MVNPEDRRQWTFRKKPCPRCLERERIVGGVYCVTCGLICPRCEINPKAGSSGWCTSCKRAAKKRAPTEKEKQEARARALVSRAVANGTLVKTPCQEAGCCGRAVLALILEPSRPMEVIWLCRTHHSRARNRLRCGTYTQE